MEDRGWRISPTRMHRPEKREERTTEGGGSGRHQPPWPILDKPGAANIAFPVIGPRGEVAALSGLARVWNSHRPYAIEGAADRGKAHRHAPALAARRLEPPPAMG